MEKGRSLIRWTAIFITFVMASFLIGSPAVFGVKTPPQKTLESRADIIRIDSMRVFGKLTRPPVTYLHQKHTEALENKNKDCSACHLSQDNLMSTKFLRLQNTAKEEVMDIYHTNCISCHKETAANKEKSGPVVCGECHKDDVGVVSSWQPIGMDKSLHYRHTKAQADKCENCHHVYNEATKTLYYAKGEEGTCRYCHQEKTEDNRISLRLASHTGCVNCHSKTLAKNESAGPVRCYGCHDADQQKLIARVENAPRMQVNQPDFVFVRSGKEDRAESNPGTRMHLVPFNHKAHEAYNDTCRVCHHANLKACNDCHTLYGAKDGKFVKLEQAMHQRNVDQSCMGCHEARQSDTACAGCHTSFERKREEGTSSCLNCHMVPPSQIALGGGTQVEAKTAAARALENREAVTRTYDAEDIPETVDIKILMNQYEPVKLPHRKIVLAMVNNISTNKLANYFHHEKGTVCQGCHHNSPASTKPPRCVSCHGKPFNDKDPFKPGLMAAYHRQCMECHEAMGIKKPVETDCTACHAKRT
ncbi:MAG: hypothetical protein JSW26_14660 [Desulfobacterales bacterium]|nr:MAG: hypothetical protein JSW26_14660 [Desulfobacterales bacterium]